MFTMKGIISLDITLMLVLYIYIPFIKYKGNLHTNEVDIIVYFYKKINLGCIFDRAKF